MSTAMTALVAALALLLPAAAGAVTLLEPVDADFGDSFSERTVVPLNVDEVLGAVSLGYVFDPNIGIDVPVVDLDFVAFAGLVVGTAFTITIEDQFSDQGLAFVVFDGDENTLFSGGVRVDEQDPDNVAGTAVFDGIVPASGELVVRLRPGDDSSGYRVALVAQVVPEPAAALLVGGGLALLAGGRRRARGRATL